jgi:hypothetical protein
MPYLNRRTFIQSAAASGVTITANGSKWFPQDRDRIRVAVVGTGQRAVNVLAALSVHPVAQIHMIVGSSAAHLNAMSKFLAQHGVRTPELVTDARRAVDSTSVQAICFASTSSCSASFFDFALTSGKNLFFDSPSPLSLDDAHSAAKAITGAKGHVVTCLQDHCAEQAARFQPSDAPVRAIGTVLGVSLRSAAFSRRRTFDACVPPSISALIDRLMAISAARHLESTQESLKPKWICESLSINKSVFIANNPLMRRVQLDGLRSRFEPSASLHLFGDRGETVIDSFNQISNAVLVQRLTNFLNAIQRAALPFDHTVAQRAFIAAGISRWLMTELPSKTGGRLSELV